MNQLRDVWRIRWQVWTAGFGPDEIESGLWVMPHEVGANMVARDLENWLAQTFPPLPEEDNPYPIVRGAIVYRMDCGVAVEVARVKVVRKSESEPFMRDGFKLNPSDSWQGSLVRTQKDWSELRENS